MQRSFWITRRGVNFCGEIKIEEIVVIGKPTGSQYLRGMRSEVFNSLKSQGLDRKPGDLVLGKMKPWQNWGGSLNVWWVPTPSMTWD